MRVEKIPGVTSLRSSANGRNHNVSFFLYFFLLYARMREKLSNLRGYICVGGPIVDTDYMLRPSQV